MRPLRRDWVAPPTGAAEAVRRRSNDAALEANIAFGVEDEVKQGLCCCSLQTVAFGSDG